MLDWTNCKKEALSEQGDLISWPPQNESDVILKSLQPLEQFCQEEEVDGPYILPISVSFEEGVLFCRQECY